MKSDQIQINLIKIMSFQGLLELVLDHPYYLTDSQYLKFGAEIHKRADKLSEND